MIIIGIDPGRTGGIAYLNGGGFGPQDWTIEVQPMPEALPYACWMWKVADECKQRDRECHVFIEKSQAMPGQGVSSMFNYGVHFGELLGVIRCLGIPHTLVPPRTWTKVMHAGTKAAKPKERSLEVVRRLFPNVNLLATERCKKPHEGIVDALLIMEYGRRILGKARYG